MKSVQRVINPSTNEAHASVLWMVRYDLHGLHRPVKMTLEPQDGREFSRNVYRGHNVTFRVDQDHVKTDDYVLRFFPDKESAQDYYKNLLEYRDFIKSKI